jgi:UDP-N-acetylglucosamine 4,6-dehydratase
MGSRGSVIPFFVQQAKKGILPITDPRMTRVWITLEQGVEFVLFCLEWMVGGELFVPKIPSMGIMDLAEAICPECKIEVIGIRPGEKLHEMMIPRDEAQNTVEAHSHYIIKPPFDFFGRRFNGDKHSLVSPDFEYSSDKNPQQLTVEQLRTMIGGLG